MFKQLLQITYLSSIEIKSTDAVLDIGCGDGSYSLKIIKQFPMASFLGIDASENMLALAREITLGCPNVRLQKADVATMDFDTRFDYVLSFWCLQWTQDIKRAFENIFKALKKGGKILTIFPTGDDPFMTSYKKVKKSRRFRSLDQFVPPVNYRQLDNLQSKINLPFKYLRIERHRQALPLPSLDIFRKFVNGIAFYQGQIPIPEIEDINEAMVQVFKNDCQKRYQGNCIFEFTNYFITAEK